jgi:hypothetical protein
VSSSVTCAIAHDPLQSDMVAKGRPLKTMMRAPARTFRRVSAMVGDQSMAVSR